MGGKARLDSPALVPIMREPLVAFTDNEIDL